MYSMVQRREKEKDSRYIQKASAPAAVTVYQTCNIMYICNICVEILIARSVIFSSTGTFVILYMAFRVCTVRMHAHSAGISS